MLPSGIVALWLSCLVIFASAYTYDWQWKTGRSTCE